MSPVWLRSRPIAHRGLHDGFRPENSIPAFARAIQSKTPFELDVQLTADKIPVVFHDDNLLRMTGVNAQIGIKTSKELRRYRLLKSRCIIPTLKEVLKLCQGRVPILIEIKNEFFFSKLEAEVLREISQYSGPLAIQSFNPWTLLYFRFRAPRVPRGQLVSDLRDRPDVPFVKRFAVKHMLGNIVTSPDFISYEQSALREVGMIRLRSKIGTKPVLLWTVREPATLQRARRYGFNIIFEGIDPTHFIPDRGHPNSHLSEV